MSIDIDRNDAVDALSQHYTDTVEEKELTRLYYDVTYASLNDETGEELAERLVDTGLFKEAPNVN